MFDSFCMRPAHPTTEFWVLLMTLNWFLLIHCELPSIDFSRLGGSLILLQPPGILVFSSLTFTQADDCSDACMFFNATRWSMRCLVG